MSYKVQDHFFHRAKKENFVARSVYKLQELDRKFRLLRPGQKVLDLGAAPGSWSQYAAERIGVHGSLLGVDLQEIAIAVPRARWLQEDVRFVNWAEVAPDKFDVVLSDMAPKTTGIAVTDQARSLDLCESALQVAEQRLAMGGIFVCKLFHSQGFETLRHLIQARFQRFEAYRPEATRSASREIFLVGIGFRGSPLVPQA